MPGCESSRHTAASRPGEMAPRARTPADRGGHSLPSWHRACSALGWQPLVVLPPCSGMPGKARFARSEHGLGGPGRGATAQPWLCSGSRPLGCSPSEAPRGRRVDRSNTATRSSGLQRMGQRLEAMWAKRTNWSDSRVAWQCWPNTWGPRHLCLPCSWLPACAPGGEDGSGSGQTARPASHDCDVKLLLLLSNVGGLEIRLISQHAGWPGRVRSRPVPCGRAAPNWRADKGAPRLCLTTVAADPFVLPATLIAAR